MGCNIFCEIIHFDDMPQLVCASPEDKGLMDNMWITQVEHSCCSETRVSQYELTYHNPTLLRLQSSVLDA